jgi:DNA-binding transcriptional ArsR family regulator
MDRVQSLMSRSEDLSNFLSAIASSKRTLILCCLARHECNVGELSEAVGLPQTVISQHLSKLRALKLVRTRREAQNIFYSIANDHVVQLVDLLCDIFCGDDDQNDQAVA